MEFKAEDVKKLREITGAGFADCRSALTEAKSFDEAKKILEEKGQKRAEKVKGQERDTTQGAVVSYIHHGNNVGVLVEMKCSTDFVARNEDFRTLGREIAIQIAGYNPKYISFTDIPENIITAAKSELEGAADVKKKPVAVRSKIVEGRLQKMFAPEVLMLQPWVKDETKTIGALIDDLIRKTGENIVVRRFSRFEIGKYEDSANQQ